MATVISTYASDLIIDWLSGHADPPATGTRYISLHSGDPGYTGANEITAGGHTYARKSLTPSGASSGRHTDNGNLLQWLDMPAVTVSYVGIWDALAAGNFLWGGALAANKTTNAGDTLEIEIADLDLVMP